MAAARISLRTMNESQLIAALIAEVPFRGIALYPLTRAIDLGGVLHRYQVRHEVTPDGRVNPPYFEHPLRNTVRLARWGVTHRDVLIASLLHDTVEDCAKVFVATYLPEGTEVHPLEARRLLTAHLDRAFGQRARDIVLGVTNPYYTRKQWAAFSPEEKRELYRTTVEAEIASDPDVFLVKFSDFIDNAGSLHSLPEERFDTALRLAQKYHPLIEAFRLQLHRHDLRGRLSDLHPLEERLLITEESLLSILARG